MQRPRSLDRKYITSDTEVDPKFTLAPEAIAFKFTSSLQYLGSQKTAPHLILLSDLERLTDGECWNDTLVDFALTLWFDRFLLSQYPAAKSTPVYSTFFYSRYEKKGYDAVYRWSKKDNPFTYQNIVVPVHLGNHWVVVIICDPSGLVSDHLGQKCSIISLDSLNHPCTKIRDKVIEWLLQEATKCKIDIATPPTSLALQPSLQPNM
ncbi:hypothetical protein M422DRAFT_276563 [Sphaerobolus stellatus SS14]|uniref:Ubiquitin-like protease family profile domain-containing protein n=1 Tax=Sphaerobolus stellatus (strain SS14) TaxID=990650 RepID=A0A0C9T2F3_SPHS4|nr:hypothetical protein M422DRAFT_276563 [Sphaerobolus stellatus SS14]